ncbi:hypothetical protein ACSBR2_017023 [Camellia fascicularis]
MMQPNLSLPSAVFKWISKSPGPPTVTSSTKVEGIMPETKQGSFVHQQLADYAQLHDVVK